MGDEGESMQTVWPSDPAVFGPSTSFPHATGAVIGWVASMTRPPTTTRYLKGPANIPAAGSSGSPKRAERSPDTGLTAGLCATSVDAYPNHCSPADAGTSLCSSAV